MGIVSSRRRARFTIRAGNGQVLRFGEHLAAIDREGDLGIVTEGAPCDIKGVLGDRVVETDVLRRFRADVGEGVGLDHLGVGQHLGRRLAYDDFLAVRSLGGHFHLGG